MEVRYRESSSPTREKAFLTERQHTCLCRKCTKGYDKFVKKPDDGRTIWYFSTKIVPPRIGTRQQLTGGKPFSKRDPLVKHLFMNPNPFRSTEIDDDINCILEYHLAVGRCVSRSFGRSFLTVVPYGWSFVRSFVRLFLRSLLR
mmetsp:Transcript_13604/g.31891  ORF Transcript_13604/g.31891 Transcript_13604/m.31891 type:complete len:144 (+) Transcript_13604:86-517(+)